MNSANRPRFVLLNKSEYAHCQKSIRVAVDFVSAPLKGSVPVLRTGVWLQGLRSCPPLHQLEPSDANSEWVRPTPPLRRAIPDRKLATRIRCLGPIGLTRPNQSQCSSTLCRDHGGQLGLHAGIATAVLRVLFGRTVAPILISRLVQPCLDPSHHDGFLDPLMHVCADSRD